MSEEIKPDEEFWEEVEKEEKLSPKWDKVKEFFNRDVSILYPICIGAVSLLIIGAQTPNVQVPQVVEKTTERIPMIKSSDIVEVDLSKMEFREIKKINNVNTGKTMIGVRWTKDSSTKQFDGISEYYMRYEEVGKLKYNKPYLDKLPKE